MDAGNCCSDVIFSLEMQRLVKLEEFFLRRKQPDDAAQRDQPAGPFQAVPVIARAMMERLA